MEQEQPYDALVAELQHLLDLARAGDISDKEWRNNSAAAIYISEVHKEVLRLWLMAHGSDKWHLREDLEAYLGEWVVLVFTGKAVSSWMRDTPSPLSVATTENAASLLSFVKRGMRMRLGYRDGYKDYNEFWNKAVRSIERDRGTDRKAGRQVLYFDPAENPSVFSETHDEPVVEPIDQPTEVARRFGYSFHNDVYSQTVRLAVSTGITFPRRLMDPQTRHRLLCAVLADPKLAARGLRIADGECDRPDQMGEVLALLVSMWRTVPVTDRAKVLRFVNADQFAHYVMLGSLVQLRRTSQFLRRTIKQVQEIFRAAGLSEARSLEAAEDLVAAETTDYRDEIPNMDMEEPPKPRWMKIAGAVAPSAGLLRHLFEEAIEVISEMMGPDVSRLEQPTDGYVDGSELR